MNHFTERVLEETIREQFRNNEEAINGAIFRRCEMTDSRDVIYAKTLVNAMEVSANMSAKIIMEILLSLGVLDEKDENELRRKVLHIVKRQEEPKE